MHPKVQRFLEITKEHKENLQLLHELSQMEADIRQQMIVDYLEFSDASSNRSEWLALKIAKEAIARQLGESTIQIEVVKTNIKIVQKLIQRLV